MTTLIDTEPPLAVLPSNCRPLKGRPLRGSASQFPTNHLPFRRARNNINGAAFAAWLGTPLTVHLTLHWRLFGKFDPGDPIGSQGRIINGTGNWLADRGIPFHYVWVRENGLMKGEHLHWLLHLPVRHWRDFRWFPTRIGGCFTIPGRTEAPFKMEGGTFGMWKPTMWAGATLYTIKSMAPHARLGSVPIMKALGIKPKSSLPLQGLRSATSHSLSISARKAAGWRELVTLDELHAVLHPNVIQPEFAQ